MNGIVAFVHSVGLPSQVVVGVDKTMIDYMEYYAFLNCRYLLVSLFLRLQS